MIYLSVTLKYLANLKAIRCNFKRIDALVFLFNTMNVYISNFGTFQYFHDKIWY